MANKASYTIRRKDGSYEYGVILQESQRPDIKFPVGVTQDFAEADKAAVEARSTMLEYLAITEYRTPGGSNGKWSQLVLAFNQRQAEKTAEAMLRERRKIGKINKFKVLPYYADSLHPEKLIARLANRIGNGESFSAITPDLLSAVGDPATDKGMLLIRVQNIVRAALRERAELLPMMPRQRSSGVVTLDDLIAQGIEARQASPLGGDTVVHLCEQDREYIPLTRTALDTDPERPDDGATFLVCIDDRR